MTDPQMLARDFAKDGFVGPLRAISEADAALAAEELRAELRDDNYSAHARRNRHFDLPSVRKAATAEALIETVRAVYSGQLLLWRSHVFTGRPGRGLGWHSDRFTTLLADSEDHLTAHLALTDAPADNCMKVIPGSHQWSEEKRQTAGFHLIEKTAGTGYGTPYYQRMSGAAAPQAIPLAPGEFFLFHPATLHASVDRLGDNSNRNPFVSFAKRTAKSVVSRFEGKGLIADPPRLAIGLRFCDPRNTIAREAFDEMSGRGTSPAMVAGSTCPDFALDWR